MRGEASGEDSLRRNATTPVTFCSSSMKREKYRIPLAAVTPI
jgi:hypothetical protein